jgi:Cu/Ag efflux pump CusA
VVVWSTPETRHSLNSINDLLIDTPDGGQVRLGDVAQVKIVPRPSVIRHEGVKRYFDVVADVQGRDLGSVATDIRARVSQLQFPLEYHAEVLGDFESAQAARIRILGVTIIAAIALLFLLQAAVRSWRLAAVVLATWPVVLVGGLVAAFLTGGVLSLGSLLGFLVVLGIAARTSVLLVRRYQHLERDEGVAFGMKLVTWATTERLSPIVATAIATAVAFVPALIVGDQPGFEIVRPMVIVILGGLVTMALVNLFILPAIYLGLAIKPAQELGLASDNGLTNHSPFGTVSKLPGISGGS